ncbi:conserved hypothetical protein [Ricinus communis]|uniref:Uncharacterized protein n=1 Tax=Ricinus communis TaxID=3988 RepID=B9RTH2_RICCO|nr:conserved hypothetical protein [Ricinus communis]
MPNSDLIFAIANPPSPLAMRKSFDSIIYFQPFASFQSDMRGCQTFYKDRPAKLFQSLKLVPWQVLLQNIENQAKPNHSGKGHKLNSKACRTFVTTQAPLLTYFFQIQDMAYFCSLGSPSQWIWDTQFGCPSILHKRQPS